MSTIIKFPDIKESDRALIHSIVESFCQGKITRSEMMQVLNLYMEQRCLKKLHIFGYTIQRYSAVDSEGIIKAVIIKGNQIVDKCPCCGNDQEDSRYLYTNKENLTGTFDVITVTCLKCWCVYSVKAKNGRKKWNADIIETSIYCDTKKGEINP